MRSNRGRQPAQAFETLRGRLEYFSRKTEDGWGVGALDVDGSKDRAAIVGKVLDAKPGDSIELTGRWAEHATFGKQFRIDNCVVERAESVDGVVAWLKATLPNVGEMRARALVSHFGSVQALWHAIEHEHHRLCEVEGITSERAEAIHSTYSDNRAQRDNMVALRAWGLTANQIQRCLDTWHTYDEVVMQIRANPYLLARHVRGFGFERADKVAKLAGVKHNAPERIEAGIVHVLDQATGMGNCYMWGGALQRMAAEDLLDVTHQEAAGGIMRAWRSRLIVRRGARIYSARMEAAESSCARNVLTLIATPVALRSSVATPAEHSGNGDGQGWLH